MLAKREVIQLLTHATVFACPSLYEPLGIVNLEAMACGTAVVGSKVGGIPEVVADGQTGLLVPPGDPAALAQAVNELVTDERQAAEMGRRGRARAEAEFGWASIAAQTAELYAELTGGGGRRLRPSRSRSGCTIGPAQVKIYRNLGLGVRGDVWVCAQTRPRGTAARRSVI